MLTLKELIETSIDHSDYMVRRLWNQGNKVALGPKATQFIDILKENLTSWLNDWDSSQVDIKATLNQWQNQSLLDLANINVPHQINSEMLKKGYMLAIAGHLGKDPAIIAILNQHPNRKNWPTIIKFIQSGDEGLQKRSEYKESLEAKILTGLPLIKQEIHDAVSNVKTSLPYREIGEYDDQKTKAHSAANNVLHAIKKLGVSASEHLSKNEINTLKEHLVSNLKLLNDGFENLDPETDKDLSDFFRKNSDMILKAMDKIPARSLLTFRSSSTSREEIQDLLDKCRNKAYARPALELAVLSINAKHLTDESVDSSVFFQQAKKSGLIGSANIEKWKNDKDEISKISQHITTVGQKQFGERFFDYSKSAVSVALFLNQASKNINDPDLYTKLKSLPTIGLKQDKNWENATTAKEKKQILAIINDQATKIYGAELFNTAKNVVRETKQPQKKPAKWVNVETRKSKRFSGTPKRDSQKGPEY